MKRYEKIEEMAKKDNVRGGREKESKFDNMGRACRLHLVRAGSPNAEIECRQGILYTGEVYDCLP